MAGDAETGVGIMQMAEGLDTGDVLAENRVTIDPKTTAGSLHDELAVVGARLMVETIAKLGSDSINPQVQSEIGVTYAKKIEKAEALIDWHLPAPQLSCHIRGLSPFPGAYFEYEGTRVKVLNVEVISAAGKPGELIDDNLCVACGEDALRLTLLQRAGKSPMDSKTFLNGFPLPKGTQLA